MTDEPVRNMDDLTTANDKVVENLMEENARLRLELENAQLKLSLHEHQAALRGNPPLEEFWKGEAHPGILADHGPAQPHGPGGAPVPRAPVVPVQTGPPKQGDIVNVACRSGARTPQGDRCQGRKQMLQAVVSGGESGRRVIYVCQSCRQPWNVTY